MCEKPNITDQCLNCALSPRQEGRASGFKEQGFSDKSLKQHQTEIIRLKSKLATLALIVIANERTAETYPIREETHNNERKSD